MGRILNFSSMAQSEVGAYLEVETNIWICFSQGGHPLSMYAKFSESGG